MLDSLVYTIHLPLTGNSYMNGGFIYFSSVWVKKTQKSNGRFGLVFLSLTNALLSYKILHIIEQLTMDKDFKIIKIKMSFDRNRSSHNKCPFLCFAFV